MRKLFRRLAGYAEGGHVGPPQDMGPAVVLWASSSVCSNCTFILDEDGGVAEVINCDAPMHRMGF